MGGGGRPLRRATYSLLVFLRFRGGECAAGLPLLFCAVIDGGETMLVAELPLTNPAHSFMTPRVTTTDAQLFQLPSTAYIREVIFIEPDAPSATCMSINLNMAQYMSVQRRGTPCRFLRSRTDPWSCDALIVCSPQPTTDFTVLA